MKNCKFLFMIIFLLTTSSALNLGLWQSTTTTSISTSNALLSLQSLPLDGHFLFSNLHHAATDFGNRISHTPSAILHPRSVSDISTTLTHLYRMGPRSHLTVAARGHGHSLQGQAQAHGGIVISMESLAAQGKNSMRVHSRGRFVDVCGGELWISVLKECLKFGLAPKSWTDYLHLTVGGTLSNAGISGQAFKHGPQISNVHQLEVVTGRGEVMNCSEKQNPDLFYSVLGGLGQFGIITRARISLEPAPTKVKWIRVLYSDFTKFANDQELLITSKKNQTFDYVEGFVIINRTGILNNWRSSFNPQDPVQASQFNSDGRTLYCLEVAKYYTTEETEIAKQETERLLSSLSYIRSTLFMSEVGYLDFLDRVHVSEMKLRAKGLWQVPHPWLNLLVPRSKINEFAKGVFGNILVDTINGPILIYPVDRSKWDRRTSAVIPEEEEGEDDQIFYLVALLSSAVPNSNGKDGLEYIDRQNRRVLEFCERGNLGVKQYLPHYSTQEQWKTHFGGSKWQVFRQRKREYDPLSLLGPGHRIFAKGGGGDAFL